MAYTLEAITKELTTFFEHFPASDPDADNMLSVRLDSLRPITQTIERLNSAHPDLITRYRELVLNATDPAFATSPFGAWTRTWPYGYPGDHRILEAVYQYEVQATTPLGLAIERHLQRSQLATAVRARLHKMIRVLEERAAQEQESSLWINLACGSCRELCFISPRASRHIVALDADVRALTYAQNLLAQGESAAHRVTYRQGHARRFARNNRLTPQYGQATTIYSMGYFDYVPNQHLTRLLADLYESLAPGGQLIATFKDADRYDTCLYHWLMRWDAFFQRDEEEVLKLFQYAGISASALTVERDITGVILFVRATAPGALAQDTTPTHAVTADAP